MKPFPSVQYKRRRLASGAAAIFGIILLVVALLAIGLGFTTWVLMLFLGNVGVHVGFWGCVPGTLVLGAVGGAGVSAKRS